MPPSPANSLPPISNRRTPARRQNSAHKSEVQLDQANKLHWRDFSDELLLKTLELMDRLRVYAVQEGIPDDQLAVSIHDFKLRGHSELQIRLLVSAGILLHFRETTTKTSSTRKFEKAGLYALHKSSCFLLSNAYAENDHTPAIDETVGKPTATPALTSSQPTWDSRLRKLFYYGTLIKHFRVPAQNQETILSAFEEEGWPHKISDPLPPIKSTDSKQRLHDTIRSLNRNQANSLIKFGGDGTGEGIVWEQQTAPTKLPMT